MLSALLGATALACAGAGAAASARVTNGGLVYEGMPAADATLSAELARYRQNRPLRFMDWLADGSLLVAMPVGDSDQLFRIAGPERAPEQLSHVAGALGSAGGKAYEAGGVVLERRMPHGPRRLFLLDMPGGEEQPVAGDEHVDPLWAHDGRRLAYRTADAAGSSQLYLLDSTSGSTQLLTGAGDWRALDWARDDRELLALQLGAPAERRLQRIDLASLQPQVIALAPGMLPLQARYSSDGRHVLLLARQGAADARIWRVALDRAESSALTPATLRGAVRLFDQSADGRYLAYAYDEAGYSRLVVADLRAGQERLVTALPAGMIRALKFDRTGRQLAINVESAVLPGEMQVLELASNALVRWTNAAPGALAAADLAAPLTVRVPAWDRGAAGPVSQPALVYRPARNSARTGRLPVLMVLSDVPGASAAQFDAEAQALVNVLGCALLVPVLRGEPGSAAGRVQALRDAAAALVWVGQQGDLDGRRVVIEGSGASALLALSALAQLGDRLRGGIIVDAAELPPPSQTQVVEHPVLLLRGVADSPAPYSVAEQLVWRLRVAGNDTWLLSTALEQPDAMSQAQRQEALRVRVQFLRQLFGG
jgi:dipeptidyl aminopeptidase/acylaminoacyl peptidase